MCEYKSINEADICIAMQDADPDLIEKADICAPPANQDGIIQGVQEALEKET